MKKKSYFWCYLSILFILAFVLWTILVKVVDLKAIGPNSSVVGFATINGWISNKIGVNFMLYNVTDWLGFVPIAVALSFAILGVIQWIKRKSLLKVDKNLFVLGAFYIVVFAVYVLFEFVVINRRPVLIEGILEASYPSSTTMLVLSVMPTALLQLKARIKNKVLKNVVVYTIIAFVAFMLIGRVIAGVHWFSDIIGGILFSVGAVTGYYFFSKN